MARTVLLADDSVTAQNMGRRILTDAGYEVITVNNGSAALKKIHESRPDLIVLDVYMPGYGGLEVCQRLKESGETMKIPVLLTVGKMEPFKSDEAKRVRADGHIIKPFEASELLAALAKLEDRIVPQAGSARGGNSGKEKRSRFWYGGDPVTNFADLPSDKVAYLAEVRKRQSESHVAEAPVNEESQPAVEVETPVEAVSAPPAEAAVVAEAALGSHAPDISVQETNVAPQSASQDQPASVESQAAEPVAEFPVTVEAVVEEAKVEHAIEEATDKESVPIAPAQETIVVTAEAEPSGSRWVAENVALTAEEASLALEQEMRQAQAVAQESPSTKPEPPAEVESTNFEAPESAPSTSLPVPESGEHSSPRDAGTTNTSGATFAAAASASSAISTLHSAVGMQAPLENPAENAVPDPEAEPRVPSEAAAAWENWQQIRESVMRPQQAAAIAESVAEIAQASASAQDTAPSDGASATPAMENNTIANIVDRVLAELKPKLMEEIAKKLSAEKK